MSQLHEELRWMKSPRVAVVASPENDRFAILHLDASQPVVLTGTGAAIWAALDEYSTITEISTEVAAIYDVELNVVMSQIQEFLGQLSEQSLIIPK